MSTQHDCIQTNWFYSAITCRKKNVYEHIHLNLPRSISADHLILLFSSFHEYLYTHIYLFGRPAQDMWRASCDIRNYQNTAAKTLELGTRDPLHIRGAMYKMWQLVTQCCGRSFIHKYIYINQFTVYVQAQEHLDYLNRLNYSISFINIQTMMSVHILFGAFVEMNYE